VRVEQLREEFPLDVEWRPFELRPDAPREGIPMERVVGRGRYTEQYLTYLDDAAARAGIRMKPRAILPNSRAALEAAEFAREAGHFEPLHRALFRAYFEDGEDIGDEEVLVRLAGECGLEAKALAEALRERRYEKLVDDKVRWAYEQNLGGVPAFIFYPPGSSREGDGFVLVGAQEYDVFKDIAERILRRHVEARRSTGRDP
jgi:predicted DsbA family dithiol-disulfide isomerase